MIELRHLKAIVALEDTGSVTRAAAKVHLTQSALSHQLAVLEDYLETALFERQQRPLKLTEAGKTLRVGDEVTILGVRPTSQSL